MDVLWKWTKTVGAISFLATPKQEGAPSFHFFPAPSRFSLASSRFLSIIFFCNALHPCRKLTKEKPSEMQMICIWLMWSVECCIGLNFACRSVIYYRGFKIYLASFTSKRNTLKDFVKGSFRKKQFIQQREMPKACLENGLIVGSSKT